jgi:hypothetical protein
MKLIDKFKTKQFGAFLIAVGIFIPLILYPFTAVETNVLIAQIRTAQAGGSFDARLCNLEVAFCKGFVIPYKYPVALGVLFVFIGSCFVLFFKKGGVIYL